jgi:phosphatidylglycerol---prolipoprotein diacylglyceryl transferase
MEPRFYYTLFMLLALAVFIWARQLVPRTAELNALPFSKRLLLAVAAFIGGALGAKLPFVLGATEGVFSDAAWFRDGKTVTTGLIGGYLAVEIAKWIMGIRVKTGDSFALPLALAMAVGRWGCFFNGCCYGVATDLSWGVDFGGHVYRHPTQIYESLFHLCMAGILWQLLRHRALRNQQLKLYLIAYGSYRFVTEFIRPEPAYLLDLTFYQWISVALILGLTAQWIYDARNLGVPQHGLGMAAAPDSVA